MELSLLCFFTALSTVLFYTFASLFYRYPFVCLTSKECKTLPCKIRVLDFFLFSFAAKEITAYILKSVRCGEDTNFEGLFPTKHSCTTRKLIDACVLFSLPKSTPTNADRIAHWYSLFFLPLPLWFEYEMPSMGTCTEYLVPSWCHCLGIWLKLLGVKAYLEEVGLQRNTFASFTWVAGPLSSLSFCLPWG